MFSLTYLPQRTISKSLYFFWTRLKSLKKLTFCLENFKLQSWKIKLEKWHEPRNKSEITGFYMGKNSKFTGSFSWGCFMRHRLQWFLWCCFWSPYFFNRPFCGRPCCYYYLYQLLKHTIHQHQPQEAHCFHLSSLYLLYWGTVFLILV